jgi:aspartate/methionine/tyrosine aminotransferase
MPASTTQLPARFPPAPMTSLVDRPVRFDLAESTCPALRLGEILGPDVLARLTGLEVGYGTTQGDPGLRALLAEGTGVAPDQVLLTPGAAPAMFLLAFTLTQPGDHAVLTTPCFPPARTTLDAVGLAVTPVRLRFDDGYRLDVDAVAAALTPETRLVSLASPQNPSGIRITEPELTALLRRVDEIAPHAVVLVDETYRETAFGADPVPPSVARLASRVVTCSSLSKSHGAPGLRVGWLTCTEPVLYDRLRLTKFNTLVGGSGVDELLAVEVLRQREQILGARREALTSTLESLRRWAAEHEDTVEFLPPDGGALCCLRLRDATGTHRFYEALAERDTRVAPGSWFGESDRVFRLGFGHLPVSEFGQALERLGDALSTG